MQTQTAAQTSGVTSEAVPRYVPWALINGMEGPERNIPDPVLIGIWKQMREEGKDRIVFYDGKIKCTKAWLMLIKSDHQYPVLIIDTVTEKIVMLAWFNAYNGSTAQGHFCSIGPYKRGAGDAVIRFWRSLKTQDGKPFLRTVWGMTPESYEKPLRLIKLLGFTLLGVIPNSCNLSYEGERVGGMVSFLDLTKED